MFPWQVWVEKLGTDQIRYEELHASQLEVLATVHCEGRELSIQTSTRLKLRFFRKRDRKSLWKIKIPDEVFASVSEVTEECKVAFTAEFKGLDEIQTASLELPIRKRAGLMQLSTSTRAPKVCFL